MKLNSDSIPPEILEKLHRIIGAVIDPLGKDLLTILATSQIEGEVSNSRLQYMIEQHRADITKILQDLCKQGYFLSENKGRWTTYHLNTHYLSDNLDNSKNNMDTSLPANATTLTPLAVIWTLLQVMWTPQLVWTPYH